MTISTRTWAPWVSGGLCAMWTFVAWLSVIPNQDILVDGIQAQSLVIDPRIVLAFPGQKHGGPLEYPATVFLEWLLPGNIYANAVIRIPLAFITGYVTGRLAFRLFPETRAWALLTAVAVGPTIIHGLQPPGVWWLQPNYDMAWLLVTSGALVIASGPTTEVADQSNQHRGLVRSFVAGLLVGLGLFAHPVIILLAVPLGVLVFLITRIRTRQMVLLFAGVGLGLLPAMASYFINDEVNVWDPSHKPFVYPAWLWNMGRRALGLDGIPDPATALFPYALGFSPTQVPFNGLFQSIVVACLLGVALLVSVVGVYRSARVRIWLTPSTALALTWVVAAGTMVAFITSADPVSHYSAGLAPLFWISIGALPGLIPVQPLGSVITVLVLLSSAASTWGQNFSYLTNLPERISGKAEYQEALLQSAELLHKKDVEVIYGSYLDAVPIGYASNWKLRTVSINYNRFPLSSDEQQQDSYQVAVRTDGQDGPAIEALARVTAECDISSETIDLPVGAFAVADCPTSALIQSE